MADALGYPGLVLKQRFELLEVIGEGGMSVIFKALDYRQQEMGEEEPYIALKILRTSFQNDPRFFTLLAQEAKKTQSLSHPNIVNVFDFDRSGDLTFMTMELLKGQSLEGLLQTQRLPRSFPERRQLALQILDAVIHAHQHQVVHADLKPSNIFIEQRAPENEKFGCSLRAKVFDFGIARVLHQSPQSFTGCSPAYATPATISGGTPGPYDDAFGLGCVLYALFDGAASHPSLKNGHPFDKQASNRLAQPVQSPPRIKSLSTKQWGDLQKLLLFPFYEEKNAVLNIQAQPQLLPQAQRQVLQWFLTLRHSLVASKPAPSWRALTMVGVLGFVVMTGGLFWTMEPARRDDKVLELVLQGNTQSALEYVAQYQKTRGDSPVSDSVSKKLVDSVIDQVNQSLQPLGEYRPQRARRLLDLALQSYGDSEKLRALASNLKVREDRALEYLRQQLLAAISSADFCFDTPKLCRNGMVFYGQQLLAGHPQVFETLRFELLQGLVRAYALAVYQKNSLEAKRVVQDAGGFFSSDALQKLGLITRSRIESAPVEPAPLSDRLSLAMAESFGKRDEQLLAHVQTLLQLSQRGFEGGEGETASQSADNSDFWSAVHGTLVGTQAFTPYKNSLWWQSPLPETLLSFFEVQGRDFRQQQQYIREAEHTAVKDPCTFKVFNTTIVQRLGECQDSFQAGVGPKLVSLWLADTGLKHSAYGLAVSKYELSWGDLAQFCKDHPCKATEVKHDAPALGLSENVLDQYIEWLNHKTGRGFRLLRLEEWRVLEDPLGLLDRFLGLNHSLASLTCDVLGLKADGAFLSRTPVYQGRYNKYGVYNLSDLAPELVVNGAQHMLVPGRLERFSRCRNSAAPQEYPYAAYRLVRPVDLPPELN